jgi:hypothetical protein
MAPTIDDLHPPGIGIIDTPALGRGPLEIRGDDTQLLGLGADAVSPPAVGGLRYQDLYHGLLSTSTELMQSARFAEHFTKVDHALWVLAEHLILRRQVEPSTTVRRTLHGWTLATTSSAAIRTMRAVAGYWRLVLLVDELGPDGLVEYLTGGSPGRRRNRR